MNLIEADHLQGLEAKRPKLDAEIIIKDLDTTKVCKDDLEERFRKHGKIVDISMGRGCASICYENENSAYDAVRYEHRSLLKDGRIDVSMSSKTLHPPLNRAERGSNRSEPMMRGDIGNERDDRGGDRNGPMSRGGRGGDRDGPRGGGDRSGPMMRGDIGDDRDRPMTRGDRDGPMTRGDRGGDRDGLFFRGGRSGDRDGPQGRGDRGSNRDGPQGRSDRGGEKSSPLRKERNFKEKPRDFHRFGRGNFPPRDSSPGRGFDNFRISDRHNAPHHPVQTQYSDYFDSQFPYKPNDCEIVVMNKQQREYAESIEVRLKNIGFRVDVLFLKDENLLTNTVDDISQRGCLYAMIVAPANEAKKSVTLDILHGMPQEHRNMPLDDALKLIARDFHEYLQRQREKADLNHMCYDPNGTFSGSDPEVRVLLKMLSDGQFLTLLELERLITSLEKQKELLLAVCSKRNSLDSPGLQKERMQSMHHLELQSKAFPSNQVQFNPAALLGNSNESNSMHTQEDSMVNSSYINFNSPSVKQALDNLIQSGPGLLKNLVGPPEESGEESQNTRLSDMDLGINPEITQNFPALGNFAAGGLGHNRNLGSDQPFLSGGPINNNLFGVLPQNF